MPYKMIPLMDLAKQLKTNRVHHYRTFTIHGEMVIISTLTVWEKLIPTLMDDFKEFNFSEGSNYRCGGSNKRTRINWRLHMLLNCCNLIRF